jgi:hypothetical protein
MPSSKLKEPFQISTKVDILDIQVTPLDEEEKTFFRQNATAFFAVILSSKSIRGLPI